MSDQDKPRNVNAKRWVMAGAVATAVAGASATAEGGGLKGAQSPDWSETAHDSFLLASAEGEGEGEGGEGEGEGEGEGARAVAPEVQLLTDIGFMQGHAYAGLKLYEMGEAELGVEHIGHPIEEKYEAVAQQVEKMGFNGLKAQLNAMSEAAEAGKPAEEVAALYDEMAQTLEEIRAKTDGGAVTELKALAMLTRIAADEYGAAFTDGKLTDEKEYQDSWGFLQIVKQEASELAESDNEKVATAASEILQFAENAEAVYSDVTGAGISEPDASEIYGAAARMQLAANKAG